MSLPEIRGLDRRNTPTDLVPIGEAAMGPARHPGVLGRMSLPEIRGLDCRNARIDRVGLAEGA